MAERLRFPVGRSFLSTFARADGARLTREAAVPPGGAGRFAGTITNADLTGARTYTLPNVSGTFITTGNLTDITTVGTSFAGADLTVTLTIE